jgi:hypothetical protein
MVRSPLLLLSMTLACGRTASDPKGSPAGEDTGIGSVDVAIPDFEVSGAMATTVREAGPECVDPSARTVNAFLNSSGEGDWQDQFVPWEDLTAGRGWGVVVADFNGDKILDVFLPNLGEDELFIGDDTGHFIRIDGAIPWSTRDDQDVDTTGAAGTDVDGDGDVDLYLANRGLDRLLLNQGDGTFIDATALSGLSEEVNDSISAAWGHLDNDGLPDLFVSTYRIGEFPVEDLAAGSSFTGDSNRLYRNLGGGRFEDISDTLPQAALDGLTFVSGWHDLDRDGDSDLLIVNDLGTLVEPNQVLQNNDGVLEDMGLRTSLGGPMYGMGLGVGDLNEDLVPEFLFSSWDDLVWMESDGAGDWFENSVNRRITSDWEEQHLGWGVELADLDNDRLLDALVPFGTLLMSEIEKAFFSVGYGLYNPDEQANMVFMNGGDEFEDQAVELGLNDYAMSRIMLPADLNRDGWLDLVHRSLDAPASISMAQCGSAGWLQVSLADHAPNTLGLGVRVDAVVYGHDGTQLQQATRTIQAGSTGVSSSGPHLVHFGLGDAAWVDLDIHWLDGEVTHIEGVNPSHFLEIRRS